MAYQFVHYETYGLHTRTKKSTARGVVAEAERVPTHSLHVAKPKAPKLLLGCLPSQLLKEIETVSSLAKDRSGKKKLPKDAQILLAGVVSMPLETEELLGAFDTYIASGKKSRPEALLQYDKWRKLTLKWLQETYGDALRSVVLHYDEKQVHLHYYCSNRLSGGTLNLDGLDVAGDAERALGQDRKQRNANGAARKKARAKALTAFQDDFGRAVGIPMGWARLGPQKRRMTHKEWEQEQEQSKKLAVALEKAEALERRLSSSREINADLKHWSELRIAALEASVQELAAKGDRAKPEDLNALVLQVAAIKRRLTL